MDIYRVLAPHSSSCSQTASESARNILEVPYPVPISWKFHCSHVNLSRPCDELFTSCPRLNPGSPPVFGGGCTAWQIPMARQITKRRTLSPCTDWLPARCFRNSAA
nr:uncharacterized protein LOC123761666 [Procambarus clarkii]